MTVSVFPPPPIAWAGVAPKAIRATVATATAHTRLSMTVRLDGGGHHRGHRRNRRPDSQRSTSILGAPMAGRQRPRILRTMGGRRQWRVEGDDAWLADHSGQTFARLRRRLPGH